MTQQVIMAGFGGQGILFAGKFLAYQGLFEDKKISWLPSYGPEMRGGTANCSVILSDEPVGSPIVLNPDILISMNVPSLDKYENETVAGGQIFYDSSLIDREVTRKDVEVYPIPATQMASDENLPGLANMILIGHVMAKTGLLSLEDADVVLAKMVPAKKAHLIDSNKKALELGFNY